MLFINEFVTKPNDSVFKNGFYWWLKFERLKEAIIIYPCQSPTIRFAFAAALQILI